MIFTSLNFIVFFIIVFGVHCCMPRRLWHYEKIFLLLASYYFYAFVKPEYVLIIAFSTVLDYTIGRLLAKEFYPNIKKVFLGSSIIINLSLLAYFKYTNFAIENLRMLFDIPQYSFLLNVVLPVGISFYTFQSMSYTIDIYRRVITPEKSLLDFALFVSFFPQLVAGPIVQAKQFLPQIKHRMDFSPEIINNALFLISLGYFKKTVIADNLSVFVNQFFLSDVSSCQPIYSLIAVYAFAGQIFCDFSGYSDIAIGLAILFGIKLPDNFNAPYIAESFRDFWYRWHITLSTWLRTYLYFSLGGNKAGKIRTLVNLMLTMLLGGLWHGANWTFVAWGGIHGLFLIVERLLQRIIREKFSLDNNIYVRIIRILLVFHGVCLAWIFFRSDSIEQSFDIINSICGLSYGSEKPFNIILSAQFIFMVGCLHLFPFFKMSFSNWKLKAMVTGLMGVCMITMRGSSFEFIYFQF